MLRLKLFYTLEFEVNLQKVTFRPLVIKKDISRIFACLRRCLSVCMCRVCYNRTTTPTISPWTFVHIYIYIYTKTKKSLSDGQKSNFRYVVTLPRAIDVFKKSRLWDPHFFLDFHFSGFSVRPRNQKSIWSFKLRQKHIIYDDCLVFWILQKQKINFFFEKKTNFFYFWGNLSWAVWRGSRALFKL